jgi:hypothetical protein
MRSVPKSKYDATIKELNIMSESFDAQRHEFRLAQIKREAETMKQKDPTGSYILLGIIACIKNDIKNMHRYHKNAIKCSGKSLHSIMQYSSSLYNQGFLKDCYVYSLQAHEIEPSNPAILKELLRLSYFLDLDENYEQIKQKLDHLEIYYDDPADFLEDNDDWLERAFTVMDRVIQDNPDLIIKPDTKRESLINELIEGVVID